MSDGRAASKPAAGEALLRLEGVIAGYGGGDVLHGVSFDVPAGGITCIVGPNGAGKSTLLSAVSGILRPRKGSICLRGKELIGCSPREILKRGIVQVPQNHSLFPQMTVRENVKLGGFLERDRAVTARRLKRLTELFPIVADRATEKAGALSGGQQRLVEFARSLMLDPTVVVLDEPSMGLDPRTLETVFATIKQMHADGRTLLLVEQNARAGLRLATQGIVLENGLVRLQGTGREVLEHPEIGVLYLGGAVTGARARN